MKYLRTFVSAILAGIMIGFGGLVYLSLENKVIGAFLFAVGLFTICTFKMHLFTGKVCYVFENDKSYAFSLPIIWVGNLLGTGLTAGIASLTRNAAMLTEKASALTAIKVSDSFLSLFLLGVLCNVLIYLAVEGYRSIPHDVGKYLALIFGVMVFILAGTEHCVADMFYFWMGKTWTGDAFLRVVIITLGNACGGLILPLLRKFANKDTEEVTT